MENLGYGDPTPTRTPSSGRERNNIFRSDSSTSGPSHTIDIPSVKLQDLAVADICWLTDSGQVTEDIVCMTKHECSEGYLRDQAFRHPIAIVGWRQRPGSLIPGDVLAQFCVISSHGNEQVKDFVKVKSRLRKFFFLIPIRQDPARPEDGVYRRVFSKAGETPTINRSIPDPLLARSTLQLELSPESQLLQQQSFINPEHVWEMSVRYIKPYCFRKPFKHAYSCRLSEDSYNILAAKCGVEAQKYDPITDIKERTYESICEHYLPSLGTHIQLNPITNSNYGINSSSSRTPMSPLAGVSGMMEPTNRRGRYSAAPVDYFSQHRTPPQYSALSDNTTQNLPQSRPSSSSFSRLNPAALNFSPRSFHAPALNYTQQPQLAIFPSLLAFRPSLQTPNYIQQPRRSSFFSPEVSRSLHEAPTSSGRSSFSPFSGCTQEFRSHSCPALPITSYLGSQSSKYQTSSATQEPVIPITQFLLRHGIGRTREFVFAPVEPLVVIDFMLSLADMDILGEAVCPNEFEEEAEDNDQANFVALDLLPVLADEDGSGEATCPDEFEEENEEDEEDGGVRLA